MKSNFRLNVFLSLLGVVLLSGCETADLQATSATDFPDDSGVMSNADAVENSELDLMVMSEQEENPETPDYILRARILADMLYEASIALDDNRLLFPAGDNAYDLYQEVLSIDPDNQVALQGIEAIVSRYLSMANRAIELGQFSDAEEYLDRAAAIRPGSAALAETRILLEQERTVKRDYFNLDPVELSAQSVEIMSQIGSIGEYVKSKNATFMITARNDAEARWIYQVMREAVDGYRLRGNIRVGNQPIIQVDVPQS